MNIYLLINIIDWYVRPPIRVYNWDLCEHNVGNAAAYDRFARRTMTINFLKRALWSSSFFPFFEFKLKNVFQTFHFKAGGETNMLLDNLFVGHALCNGIWTIDRKFVPTSKIDLVKSGSMLLNLIANCQKLFLTLQTFNGYTLFSFQPQMCNKNEN